MPNRPNPFVPVCFDCRQPYVKTQQFNSQNLRYSACHIQFAVIERGRGIRIIIDELLAGRLFNLRLIHRSFIEFVDVQQDFFSFFTKHANKLNLQRLVYSATASLFAALSIKPLLWKFNSPNQSSLILFYFTHQEEWQHSRPSVLLHTPKLEERRRKEQLASIGRYLLNLISIPSWSASTKQRNLF